MKLRWPYLLVVGPVIAASLLLAARAGGQEEPPTVGLETYVCTDYGWSLSFPEGWLWGVTDGCRVNTTPGCSITIFAPGTREVWVRLLTGSGWSESEYWTYFEIAVESAAEKGWLVHPPEYLSINGVPGVRRDLSVSPGRRTMAVDFVLQGQEAQVYLEFDAPDEQFGAYEDTFEQIVGSFRLGAACPPAASPAAETATATPAVETATPVPTPETVTITPAAETPTVAPTPETATATPAAETATPAAAPTETPTPGLEVALITKVRGDVSVSGSDKRGEDLKDQLLTEGQVITTGPDGYVQVAFVNKHTVDVGPNTKLTASLESLHTPAVDITIGELRAKVMKLEPKTDFRIRMPAAAWAVRGTEVIAKVTEDESRVTVLEGSVDVWTPDESQRVTVEENEEVVATAEGLGDPYPIDPDEIDRWWEAAFGEEETDITDWWWLALVAVAVVLVIAVAGWVIVRRRTLA